MSKGVYKHHASQALNLIKNGVSVNKGKKYSEEHRKGIALAKMGEKNPMFGNGEAREGENNPNWKGDDITYSGLHHRIRKIKGTPKKCEFCGANGLSGQKIHWANVDHKYKNNLEDWLRLCSNCHKAYDIGRKQNG